jgi:hypothetical protein
LINLNSNAAQIIRQSKIIIVDEKSMMHFHLLDALDRFLQQLMTANAPFGGKLVVLMGDFRQILPVIVHGHRADTVNSSIKSSNLWPLFTMLTLTQNMRVQRMIDSDPQHAQRLRDYADWLIRVGDGTEPVLDNNAIVIPPNMVCPNSHQLQDKVYNDFQRYYKDPQYLKERCIMSCTNKYVIQQNTIMLQKVPGEVVISQSIDRCIEEDDMARYDEGLLNAVQPSGMPPHQLELKVNAVILLLKNLNVKAKHCNGTRYIIKTITDRIIVAQLLWGEPDDIILIPKIPLVSHASDFSCIFRRLQFPVLLAYYLTFNRAQGQSLSHSGLDLPQSVFSHGQLYTGFSRCGEPDNVFVYADQSEFSHLPPDKCYTRNIVYKEIFH